MNKLIVLLLTFSLISCVQQVEPIDENAEPAKLNQILVSEIKTDRAQISWSQDVAGTGYVEYGFTTSYGSISPMQKSNLLDHTIQLANLSADTVYHYKIVSVDKNLNRVLSGDMTFKTAKVEATPVPTPIPSPTPSPVKEAKAPSLVKAVLSGDNYILTLSQAADSLTPAGGYDTFINNQDQNDNASFSGLTRTISGLDKTKEQCFKVEARYTQLTPQVFPSSNEICVAGVSAPAPSPAPTPAPTPLPQPTPAPNGELKAFPSAEGFGKYASGGRKGKVLFVTNLKNSGAGSLRAAVEASGPRIVVFKVGGTISLSSGIIVENPDLTIAGQTAPGDGILIKGAQFQISASNVIIRHVRFRMGGGPNYDALRIVSTRSTPMKNIIIDHCSMSWATDENIGIGVVRKSGILSNVTVQNSILGEAGYGTLISHRTYDVSFYHNYLAHNKDRNVRIGGYSDQDEPRFALRAEFINNIAYGMGTVTNITYGLKYAAYGNVYKLSKAVPKLAYNGSVFGFTKSGEHSGYRVHSEVYLDDNILIGNGSLESSTVGPYKVSVPFNSSKIEPILANTLESSLFKNVGAFPLDSVDIRLINSYKTGAGAGAKIYPVIKGGTAPIDSDNDGMSDAWEKAMGLKVGANDSADDKDGDGYTNIEEYINSIVGE